MDRARIIRDLRKISERLRKHDIGRFPEVYEAFAERLSTAVNDKEVTVILEDIKKTFGGMGTINDVSFGRVNVQGYYKETPEQSRDFKEFQQLLDRVYTACTGEQPKPELPAPPRILASFRKRKPSSS